MIDLSKQLNFLPEQKITELTTITERICETGMVSMIVLYGSYARGEWKEHVGGRSGKKSDYDILVLTKDERDCQDLRRKLHQMFENFPTVVQAVVETVGFVNMHLRERQYFFTEIKREGIVLYRDHGVTLAEPEQLSRDRLKEIAEQDFRQWLGTAEENYDHALFAKRKYAETNNHKSAKKAAFEFQQCVENCYTTIEMVFSRNNPYEHRLTILRIHAERFVPAVDSCFPLEGEGFRLFYHLDNAYIGGRYIDEENYAVTVDQLIYWEQEAKKLLAITEEACRRWIEGM